MKLVSVAEMQAIEQEANQQGWTYAHMMEKAGQGLAELVHAFYGYEDRQTVLGLVGSGNNGGDTLIALEHLAKVGWQARAFLGQFILVSVIGLAIRTPLVAVLEAPMTRLAESLITLFEQSSLPLPALPTPEVLGANLALATVVIVVLFWNFLANRFWTYSDVE